MTGKLNDIVAETTKIVSNTDNIIRISLKQKLRFTTSYLSQAQFASLLKYLHADWDGLIFEKNYGNEL